MSTDFYLRLREGTDEPRACWRKRRLRGESRTDWMLVAIEPPIIGQRFGLGSQDVYLLLLATRFREETLFPVSVWPVHVYVLRPLITSILDREEFNSEQVELIDWGVLFPSYLAATEAP